MRGPSANHVPCGPISEAVYRSGMSPSDICRNLGWLDRSGSPSTSRLQRRLGRMEYATTHKGVVYRGCQRYIDYDLAVSIVRAAGLDPVDAGL